MIDMRSRFRAGQSMFFDRKPPTRLPRTHAVALWNDRSEIERCPLLTLAIHTCRCGLLPCLSLSQRTSTRYLAR